jgi:hypothetical protein
MRRIGTMRSRCYTSTVSDRGGYLPERPQAHIAERYSATVAFVIIVGLTGSDSI